jgi:hypothetical protein
MNVVHFVDLVESHWTLHFLQGTHMQVVAPKYNEWGTNYWLAHFLEGKQTLIVSLMDSKGNQFLIGSMVIKGEYLTQDERTWKKCGYVFQDYRPGESIYHFTNLVIGTNLQLQTMTRKHSSKVQYFLPYFEHEKLMDTISIRSDLDGLLE